MARTLGIDLIAFDNNMQQRISAAKPTYIGKIEGVRYYEHPFYGDEVPLICFINGTWYQSQDFEVE